MMNISSLISFTPRAIVQSNTTVIDPPLLGIIVSAPGDLVVKNEKDETVTINCPEHAGGTDEGGRYPFTIWGRIRQVLASTTIADADMIGLR